MNFSVPPDLAPEFTRFYHHEFLPTVASESPEVANIRRYEEFGVGGSLRWYNKQYLTIYQLTDLQSTDKADLIFQRPGVKQVVGHFRDWKEKSLRNFSRLTFVPTWTHARNDGEPFLGPFFLWQLEMKPEMDAEFQEWYQNKYLPLQIADIPTWRHASRYASRGAERLRHLTIFESAGEPELIRSIEDLRAAHRIQENYQWQRRVEAAVTWQDASSFRPIFRWPD